MILTYLFFFFCCRPGSVVAETVVEYSYPNNETQIQFLNNDLEERLSNILNDTSTLDRISQAFDGVTVELNRITFLPPEVYSEYIICHLQYSIHTPITVSTI